MYQARPARREDHAEYVEFQRQLGVEQPPFEINWWDRHYRAHTFFLETEHGELVAYALTIALGLRGDVRQIAVDPQWRGRGIGKELMAIIATRFREAGCSDWRLEVRADNEAAIGLYRSVGMDVIHEIDVLRMSRFAAEQFGATRSGTLRVEDVSPAHDSEIETRYDFGAGQLARWRTARPSSTMLQIRGGALVHYAAALLPDCGLLFPFRANDEDHAAHMIAAVVTRGTPSAIEVGVVEKPVAEGLRAAGAKQHEHHLEMGGAL
ncbi:MAG TPA: GNAT family N-acetyltransferase [Kofleriaceae bacterium]